MTSIIIYTTKEKFEHKKDMKYFTAFWTFSGYPNKFRQYHDLVFFAFDKHIQGFFYSDAALSTPGKPIPDNAVKFVPCEWIELEEKIPTKQFQGFKYADKVPELTEIVKKETMEV